MPSSIAIISSSSADCSHLSVFWLRTTSLAPTASARPLPSPSFSPTCPSKCSGLLCQEAHSLCLPNQPSCIFLLGIPYMFLPGGHGAFLALGLGHSFSLFMWFILTAPWAFTAANPSSISRAGTWWWFLLLFVFCWFGFIFALQHLCHCPE